MAPRLDVQHVPGRVADRLAEERLGVGADRLPPLRRIVGIDPRQLHAHLAQQVLELVHRPAVERRGRDDVVARLQQREQRGRLGGEPLANATAPAPPSRFATAPRTPRRSGS
jgi:hypothetical protein